MLIVADAKIPHAEEAFKDFGDVQVVPTKAMTRATIREADAILVRSETKVNENLLDGTRVRFVGTATIGTDHVDLEYLRSHNIGFESCPGSNANSVAEYVTAALLEIAAQFKMSLQGKTIGIVGHGNTGSRTAGKAEALGMHVLLNDPPLARLTGSNRYLPLDDLMNADFISLHVPLTKEGSDPTYHLFDAKRLAAMKRGAVLINTSRGPVVETEALKRLLGEGRFAACVLDVWENEPEIDGGLLEHVFIGTPHIAGYSHDGKLNATRMLRGALSASCRIPVADPRDKTSGKKIPISIRVDGADPQSSLRAIVRACYDIRRDDEQLRKIILLPATERAEYFRTLRATYPVRREFHNFSINNERIDPFLAAMLRGVGFCVSTP